MLLARKTRSRILCQLPCLSYDNVNWKSLKQMIFERLVVLFLENRICDLLVVTTLGIVLVNS